MLNSIKLKNDLNIKDDKSLEKYLWTNVQESLKQAVKVTVTTAIKAEMEAYREEINDKLSFNGYYQRNLYWNLGKIDDINVPRFREKTPENLNLQSLSVFEVEKQATEKAIIEMHRLGVSQRKVEKICKNLLGFRFSKDKVSKVHKELVQKEEFQINNKAIKDKFKYILADGIWVKMKNYGLKDNNKAVLLCVLGITEQEKREIIGFRLGYSEAKEEWTPLFEDLKNRGLTTEDTELFITDGGRGLIKTINHMFPGVKRQACITHKARNILKTVSPRNKSALGKDFQEIYQSDSKDEAKKKADDFARKWYVKEQKAVSILREDFDLTLTYMDFAKNLWSKLRTTNILEREFREVRRRIKVFDNSFNNPPSVNRYANSIFSWLNVHYPARLHTDS